MINIITSQTILGNARVNRVGELSNSYRPDEILIRPDELIYRPDNIIIRPDGLVFRLDELVYRPDELLYRRDELVYRPDELLYRPAELLYRPDSIIIRRDELYIVRTNYISSGRYKKIFTWHLRAAVHRYLYLRVTQDQSNWTSLSRFFFFDTDTICWY